MKRKGIPRDHEITLNSESVKPSTKKRKVRAKVLALLNDIVFLFFKICGYIPAHFIRKWLYVNVIQNDHRKKRSNLLWS